MAKLTQPNGAVIRYAYDLNDNVLQTTNALGAYGQSTYDFLGRKITDTQTERSTGTAYTTQYAYTAAGFLQKVTQPSGSFVTYTTNNAGDVTAVADAYGNTTAYQYDYQGRQAVTTAPDGSKRVSVYDEPGNLVVGKAYGPTGALISQISSAFDGNGNMVSATDALGHTTSFAYDPTGLLTSESQPISATGYIATSFGYDLMGHRTRYTDGRGNKHITTYNSWGSARRRSSRPPPPTRATARGRRSTTRPAGQ